MLFLLHILFYSAFPFYFATLANPQRGVAFFVYLGLLVAFASFLGNAYSLQLADQVFVSSGALAYCAFFMTAVLFVITEGTPTIVKSVFGLVILVDIFVYMLISMLGLLLEDSLISLDVSRLATPAPLEFILAGSSLLLLELATVLAVLEKAKQHIRQPRLFTGVCIVTFVLVLSGDGLLFPSLVATFTGSELALQSFDMAGRFIVALSYGATILLYMMFFPDMVRHSMQTRMHFRDLFGSTNRPLHEELEKQRRFLEMNEQQLRVLAERLSLSLDAAQMGIWEYDLRTNELSWDARAGEIYGIAPGVFEGTFTDWLSFVHPDEQQTMLEHSQSLEPDNPPVTLFFRFQPPNGSLRHLEAHSLVQRRPDGHRHMTGVVKDVTARKNMQAEHARLEQQLQQSQKMESIGQFAGGIAHDFNNLLIPILGYSELNLETADKDSTLYADLSEIREAALRAQSLIEQLMAFGRRQVIQTKAVDLNVAVRDVTAILERLVDENIHIHIDLGQSISPILADASQLEQLLLNLSGNARDAMPDGGSLTIRTESMQMDAQFVEDHPGTAQGEYSMLTVQDNGIGIEADEISHIFEPFYSTKSRDKGTGLGLASVYGIVKQHNGYIWVDSKPGTGSSFYVCFPESLRPASQAEPPLETIPVGGDETVLVVEDDASVRRSVCRTLREHGYNVLEAEQPSIALDEKLMDIRSVDMVITDMIMPGMNGEEMSKQLTARYPALRTLIMSGYTEGRTMDSGTFLQKPFSNAELLRKVHQCLNGSIIAVD